MGEVPHLQILWGPAPGAGDSSVIKKKGNVIACTWKGSLENMGLSLKKSNKCQRDSSFCEPTPCTNILPLSLWVVILEKFLETSTLAQPTLTTTPTPKDIWLQQKDKGQGHKTMTGTPQSWYLGQAKAHLQLPLGAWKACSYSLPNSPLTLLWVRLPAPGAWNKYHFDYTEPWIHSV